MVQLKCIYVAVLKNNNYEMQTFNNKKNSEENNKTFK